MSHKYCNPDDPTVKWVNEKNGKWSKSGYSSFSKEIIVDLPNKRYCFDPSKSYYLWYSEDEHNNSEIDNHGTAKTDVFVRLIRLGGITTPTTTTTTEGKVGEWLRWLGGHGFDVLWGAWCWPIGCSST